MLVAPLDSITVALKSSPNIINGNTTTIIALILRLIEYKTCFKTSGIIGSSNIIANIMAIRINGIL
jgi:hypothetical protein